MKKLISLLLAMMMVFSLATVAFASEPTETEPVTYPGSITINGIQSSSTETGTTVYKIYRLLDLESYDVAENAYSYQVNSAWKGFFETEDARDYVAIDKDGYVTWVGGDSEDATIAFSKLALAYAKANNITPVKSSENAGEFTITGTTGVFSQLPLGYYLVDSTVGALCGLTTTKPDASINAKNAPPTIDKQVEEDSLVNSGTSEWGSSNTADIGQIVNFDVTINVHDGAENYVFHDKMSEGLTYKEVTKLVHIDTSLNKTTELPKEYYEIKTSNLNDDCTFEIVFTQEFCDHLETNDKVVIQYSAMLNRNAVIAGEGNVNEAWLKYGDNHYTTHDTTKTYTFGIDIVKTDFMNKLIDGAEFRIYDAATGGNEVAVVPLMEVDDITPVLDANGNPMYRRARTDETGVAIKVKDGKVTVVGFDNGVYYLEETKAPEGYNKLSARQKFTIADRNLDAVFNDDAYSIGSGVQVVNKTGSILPQTGAMGTAMFITFGTVVMLGTGVLLVTKKRMSMIQD